MTYSLTGRTALVTGNSAGLGKSIGMALGKAGARVPINFANNRDRAEQALAEYQAEGIESFLVQADVTNSTEVDAMLEEISAKTGPVDILVPNATGPQPQLTLEETSWELYEEMVRFFIKSPFLITKALLPHWKQQKWGRIVNITSEVFHDSVAPFSAYVTAKGGQIGWTRTMAKELAPYGITVNSVAPGWIPNERHVNDPQDAKDAYLAAVPAGRWGVPEDVAQAVLYLASQQAGFVTGQTLCVNGGNTPW